ncbi:sigma-54 dependent transcriptional regulator [Guyparkeria sp. 1SP6A2]|nr:sigma-54 dependent transcriptional regulator [Guyparkeria sp. 1SP6A2]
MSPESRVFRTLLMLSYNGADAVAEAARIVEPFSWELVAADDRDHLESRLRRTPVRVVLIDLRGAMQSVMNWLPEFARRHPCLQLVAVIEKGMEENPSYAGFLHAYFFDICFSPIERSRLTFALGHAWTMAQMADRHLAATSVCVTDAQDDSQLVGRSDAMQAVRHNIRRYADNDLPVLISGPTGTGKELAARSIHQQSSRRENPFIAVNCGAVTPSLVQSELFGHEKGAFTGATKRRIGWVEAAAGGTLFLDEIGDLPLDTQVSLLRFLQQGEIQRVGGESTLTVDARIIAATHVDLEQAVADGTFREDLYFRLDVLPMHMPALAERGTDVIELAQYYLDRFCRDLGVKRKQLSPTTEAAMLDYAWPGNIRELMNRLRRGIVLSDGMTVSLPELEKQTSTRTDVPTLAEARLEAERRTIAKAVSHCGHNVTEAARLLDVSRCTLHRLIRKHRLPYR